MIHRYSILSLLIVLGLSSGCIARARLYDLNDGRLVSAFFTHTLSAHGHVWIDGDTTETARCQGEYSSVPDGAEVAIPVGKSVMMVPSGARGQAVATCTDGTVYTCEFVVSGRGLGTCATNGGHRFQLMF